MNIHAIKLGHSSICLSIDDGYGYALSGIPLRPGLIQVVVREVRLIRRGDRIVCLGWNGWERGDTSGDEEAGSRSAPYASALTRHSCRLHH